ncbi:uncharacterized protein VTP21DRAFT_4985 [Calcarisporiella thermophila]|uniref:uncharacterized protein n=1 Tax=Calcarisporiella thermophila TaxID=911321 RepID=UPI00374200E2
MNSSGGITLLNAALTQSSGERSQALSDDAIASSDSPYQTQAPGTATASILINVQRPAPLEKWMGLDQMVDSDCQISEPQLNILNSLPGWIRKTFETPRKANISTAPRSARGSSALSRSSHSIRPFVPESPLAQKRRSLHNKIQNSRNNLESNQHLSLDPSHIAETGIEVVPKNFMKYDSMEENHENDLFPDSSSQELEDSKQLLTPPLIVDVSTRNDGFYACRSPIILRPQLVNIIDQQPNLINVSPSSSPYLQLDSTAANAQMHIINVAKESPRHDCPKTPSKVLQLNSSSPHPLSTADVVKETPFVNINWTAGLQTMSHKSPSRKRQRETRFPIFEEAHSTSRPDVIPIHHSIPTVAQATIPAENSVQQPKQQQTTLSDIRCMLERVHHVEGKQKQSNLASFLKNLLS